MSESKLRTQSMDFAVSIIKLVKSLKEKRESIISNQIGRSGTSIGANIREAQYAHSKADFVAKLHIALKECSVNLCIVLCSKPLREIGVVYANTQNRPHCCLHNLRIEAVCTLLGTDNIRNTKPVGKADNSA